MHKNKCILPLRNGLKPIILYKTGYISGLLNRKCCKPFS